MDINWNTPKIHKLRFMPSLIIARPPKIVPIVAPIVLDIFAIEPISIVEKPISIKNGVSKAVAILSPSLYKIRNSNIHTACCQPSRWKNSLKGSMTAIRNVWGSSPGLDDSLIISVVTKPTSIKTAILRCATDQGKKPAKIIANDPGTNDDNLYACA